MKSRIKRFRKEIREMNEQVLVLNVNTYVTIEEGPQVALIGDLDLN